jgi:hypothetical protein
MGLSHTTFWNVWRLTPAIFLKQDENEWIVKHDCRVFDEEGIRERAEYVLHATIDLCLSAQRNRESTLSGPYTSWTIKLRTSGALLYEKADKRSPSQALPHGVEEIAASYWVTGLDGGIFWSVMLRDPWMWGFISNDDVVSD